MLEEGIEAPPFALPDQDTKEVSLEELRGRWVIIWWFVKAATPG